MARSTTHATPICLVLTGLAAVGILLGFVTDQVMYPIGFLVPAVAYEAYRTEGESTRWASWGLVALMLALVIVVVAGVDYDLRELLSRDVAYLGGERIPLGDVKVVFSAAMAALSVVLWTRTRGVYTRWLAAIIFVSAVAVVYLSAPAALGDIFDTIT